MSLEAIQLKFEAISAEAQKQIEQLEAKVVGVEKTTTEQNKLSAESAEKNAFSWTELNNALMIVTQVWGVVEGQIQKVIAAAENSTVVNAKLEAVLRATGNTAGVSIEQIDEWATSLSRATGVEDETIKNAEAMALTFGNLSGQDIPRVTQVALDMAGVMSTDVSSSLMLISRVLETGVVPRGIAFSDSLKKQVKDAVEAGDQDKALALILGELEKRYGGAAEAMNKAGTHSANLKNEFDNLLEEIGTGFIPILQVLNDNLMPVVVKLGEMAKAATREGEVHKQTEIILEQEGMTANIFHNVLEGLTMATQDQIAAARQQAIAQLDAKDAIGNTIPPVKDLSYELEKLRELDSKMNQSMLGLIRSLTDENRNYQATLDETIAKYGEESEQVKKLQADHQAATNTILYNLEVQKLAVDGLTNAEFQLALQMGETLGIFDDASVKMAMSFDKVAQALADGTLNVNDLQAALKRIAEGKDIEGWNLFTVLSQGGREKKGKGPGEQRDSGGPGMPGGVYVITPQASPEVFIPDSSGTFVPNADRALGGDTIINNVQVVLDYSPTFSSASRADIERIMPMIEEGTRRVLKNLGK